MKAIAIILLVCLGALAIMMQDRSSTIGVPLDSKSNGTPTQAHLKVVLQRLDDIEAKLDNIRSVHIHSAAREPAEPPSGDWEAERRTILEKLSEIASMLKSGVHATDNIAEYLQSAVQVRDKMAPQFIDGVRARFGNPQRLRDAFMFHSRRQLIESLGPPHRIEVRDKDIEGWTYLGGNDDSMTFYIHNGIVFSAGM